MERFRENNGVVDLYYYVLYINHWFLMVVNQKVITFFAQPDNIQRLLYPQGLDQWDAKYVNLCFCIDCPTFVLNTGQNSAHVARLCRRLGGKDPAGAVSQPNRAGGKARRTCQPQSYHILLVFGKSKRRVQTSVLWWDFYTGDFTQITYSGVK